MSYHGDCELNIIDKEPIGAGAPGAAAGTAVRAPEALQPGHLGRWERGPGGGQTIDAEAAAGVTPTRVRVSWLVCASPLIIAAFLFRSGPETWPTM